MPVDGGPNDAELGGNLRDGVFTFAGRVELVVHLPDQLHLTATELRLLVAGASAGAPATRPSRVRSDIVSKTLEQRGVDLVVLDQGIDTSTALGRMSFQILGAIAEFEHALCRMIGRVLGDIARERAGSLTVCRINVD